MPLHDMIQTCKEMIEAEPSELRDEFMHHMAPAAQELLGPYEANFRYEKAALLTCALASLAMMQNIVFVGPAILPFIILIASWCMVMFIAYRMRTECNAADLAILRELAAQEAKYEI